MNPELEIVGAPIRKEWELKAEQATIEENVLKGNAAVMGVMDRGGDVIFPGAFDKCIKGFLAHGFVAVGHRWSGLATAMPKVAKAKGRDLYTEAIFHSTTDAQDARIVSVERLANGLSVGLSVGFSLDYETGRIWFENGKEMVKYIEENRSDDLDLFDLKGIRSYKSYCRAILLVKEWFEYSLATVPMNPHALATEAKGLQNVDIDTIATEREFEAFLREAGYSRKDAKVITLHGFKAARLRDAGDEEPDTAEAESKALLLQSDYLKAVADYEAIAGASI
jgi:hypothetical protein